MALFDDGKNLTESHLHRFPTHYETWLLPYSNHETRLKKRIGLNMVEKRMSPTRAIQICQSRKRRERCPTSWEKFDSAPTLSRQSCSPTLSKLSRICGRAEEKEI